MLIYLNRTGRGKGGPEVWAGRLRRILAKRGYQVTFDLADEWTAALFNIDSQGIEVATGRGSKVGYRVANGYLPPWFEVMGMKMEPKHFSINAEIARAVEVADMVIYQSYWAKEQIDSYIQIRADRYRVIFNGVDLNQFHPSHLSGSGLPVLGTVGLLRYQYRLETFFQLSQRLDIPHRLLIVGSLDGSAMDVMARYQKDPDLGSRINYHPYVPPEELPDLYRQMSVLVHPVSGDACPNVVVEALASGVPVVAPSYGGSVEIIGDGGKVFDARPWIYDDQFVDSMVDATREILRNQESLAQQARKRAEDALDIEQMATAYLDALGLQPYPTEGILRQPTLYQRLRRKGAAMVLRPRYYGAISMRKMVDLHRRFFPAVSHSKPRIAFTLYDFHVGGIENWLYRLAKALREDFDFYFLATAVPDILPKFGEVGACAYLPSPRKMRLYLQRHNIDIVQVHNQRWPIDAALAAGVPHVIERTDGTRSCTRVSKSGLEMVIASSRGTIPQISAHIPAERIRLIYNGIELQAVDEASRKRPWPGDRFVVGRASRFGEGKNLGMLIEAGSCLKNKLPHLKIVLIGGDSEMPGAVPVEQALRQKAMPLEDTIEFMGIIQDVIPLVKGFDVGTCVSNPNNEGIPNSLIEAMACSKPVISTSVDQVGELVEDGVNGILILPGDVDALCEAILRLEADPDLRIRLGMAGRQTVEERFSLDYAARQYAAVYHELMGG